MSDQMMLDRLTRLADDVTAPDTAVADDVARGRRGLRRHRVRTGLGGVVAAGTVAGAVLVGSSLLPGVATDGSVTASSPTGAHASQLAASSPLAPAGDGSGGVHPAPSPSASGTEPTPDPATREAMVAAMRRLDPQGRHLDRSDLTGEQLGWGYDRRGLTGASLDVRWREPGQSAVGVARVGLTREPFVCALEPPNPSVQMRCETVMLGSVKATKVQSVIKNQAPTSPEYYLQNPSGTWVYGYVSPTYGPSPAKLSSLSVTPAQLGAMLTAPGLELPAPN
ncbi:hypothetical protein GCM10023258_02490 [Terrabacter aeriphilus]|uniref:Uncharacterized protein n=1 Tax=Terrabacter aeriphilus TaxID=515662 RepID=A0ABP9J2L7_9MICO